MRQVILRIGLHRLGEPFLRLGRLVLLGAVVAHVDPALYGGGIDRENAVQVPLHGRIVLAVRSGRRQIDQDVDVSRLHLVEFLVDRRRIGDAPVLGVIRSQHEQGLFAVVPVRGLAGKEHGDGLVLHAPPRIGPRQGQTNGHVVRPAFQHLLISADRLTDPPAIEQELPVAGAQIGVQRGLLDGAEKDLFGNSVIPNHSS